MWLRLVVAAHPDDTTLQDHRARWETDVEVTIERVLDVLRLPTSERSEQHVALRAFVEGMTLAVCTGPLTPDEAHDRVHSHLRWLTPDDPQ